MIFGLWGFTAMDVTEAAAAISVSTFGERKVVFGEIPDNPISASCAYQDNNSGQARIPLHDCPLSKSTCKLLNRVVLPNGTLRGVEGEGQISPIRLIKQGGRCLTL